MYRPWLAWREVTGRDWAIRRSGARYVMKMHPILALVHSSTRHDYFFAGGMCGGGVFAGVVGGCRNGDGITRSIRSGLGCGLGFGSLLILPP